MLLAACAPDDEAPQPSVPLGPLENQRTRYYFGLEQTVELHKGTSSAIGRLEDGRVLPLAQVRHADVAAWRQRHGVLSRRLVEHFAGRADTELTSIGVTYAVAADTPAVIAPASEEMSQILAAAGLEVVTVAETMPLIIGRATVAAARDIARLPEVSAVYGAYDAKPRELAINSAKYHNAGYAHDLGFTGDGQTIGVIDTGPCRIRDDHDVFSSVSYTDPSELGEPCTVNADCVVCGSGVCVGGYCKDTHGSRVAGVAATLAPDARILYATNFGPTPDPVESVACSATGIVEAYDDFVNSEVKVVVESYACDDQPFGPSELDGVVQGYHSRVHDIAIAKAAGNQIDSANEHACPDSANSICVGGSNSTGALTCFSSWRNPGYSYWEVEPDREEPDVVALAGDAPAPSHSGCNHVTTELVEVVDVTGTTGYTGDAGTSFAAPAVAGMAAVLREACADNMADWSAVAFRAALRNAAQLNAHGWRYSTLQPGTDHRDGAGLFLLGLGGYCEQEPEDPPEGYSFFLDEGAWDPTEAGTDDPPPNLTPEYSGAPPDSTTLDQNLNPTPSLTGYRWALLADGFEVNEGGTIRATFSWNACVDAADPTERMYVGTDYDLFLYNTTEEAGYYASRTFDDVNEGFEVEVTPGWDGDWAVYVIWPESSTGCGGTDNWAFVLEWWGAQ